jgi:hypothetical protein
MALRDDPEFLAIPQKHQELVALLVDGITPTVAYGRLYPNASHSSCKKKGSHYNIKYKNIILRNSPMQFVDIKKIADQTLKNLTLMAFADVGEIFDGYGKVRTIKEMPKELRMCVTEIEVEGDRVKYKLNGKMEAVKCLAKISRLAPETTAIQVNLISEEEKAKRIQEILITALQRENPPDDKI